MRQYGELILDLLEKFMNEFDGLLDDEVDVALADFVGRREDEVIAAFAVFGAVAAVVVDSVLLQRFSSGQPLTFYGGWADTHLSCVSFRRFSVAGRMARGFSCL